MVGYPNSSPADICFGDLPYQSGNLLWCLVGWNTVLLVILDGAQPPIESRSGDPEMLEDLSAWYLKCFHVPEYEQPFSNSVSGLFLLLFDSLLENRDLHLEPVILVS